MDHGPTGDNGTSANGHTRQDRHASPYPRAVFDHDGLCVDRTRATGRIANLMIGRDEHGVRADGDAAAEANGCGQIEIVAAVDEALVADAELRPVDVAAAGQEAALPNPDTQPVAIEDIAEALADRTLWKQVRQSVHHMAEQQPHRLILQRFVAPELPQDREAVMHDVATRLRDSRLGLARDSVPHPFTTTTF